MKILCEERGESAKALMQIRLSVICYFYGLPFFFGFPREREGAERWVQRIGQMRGQMSAASQRLMPYTSSFAVKGKKECVLGYDFFKCGYEKSEIVSSTASSFLYLIIC